MNTSVDANIDTLIQYYNQYFQDISQIDYLEFLPVGTDIRIEERTMGIPFQIVQLLYPICQAHLRDPRYEDIASWVLLFLNGEHYSAWNVRFRLNRREKDQKLTWLIGIKFPGSSIAYNYRLKMRTSPELEREFFKAALERKNRNYYLWGYRLKYISQFDDPQVYQEEIEFMKPLAQRDVHNYSMFHHLLVCARRCGADLLPWARELLETYQRLYQGQADDLSHDVDVRSLQSLN